MKKQTKNQRNTPKTRGRQAIKPAHPNSLLRHFRLIESKHTGRLIHHQHTSHLVLLIILAFVGILLFANQSFVAAQKVLTGNVSVGLVVSGPPPNSGAKILSPTNKSNLKDSLIEISGTCSVSSLVVIYDNASSVGMTSCTGDGTFYLKSQLQIGENALQALNYDDLNQIGPDTPTVLVTIDSPLSNSLQSLAIATTVPSNTLESPAIIPTITPSKSSCDNYNGKINTSDEGSLDVSVVCVIRGLQPEQQSAIGLVVNGGSPPYAINVDLGDTDNQTQNSLISAPKPGYKEVPVKYSVPGKYTVKVNAKDQDGNSFFTQTVIEVNGITGLNTFASIQDTALNTSWLQTSAPVYLLILAVTLGFWVGDIFDRRFGISKSRKQKRRTI